MSAQVVATDRRSRRKARTRLAILEAAQTVFLDRGYNQASVEEIANRADVAVGSIYTYFGSKEGLFRSLVEDALSEDEAAMNRAHGSSRDPLARLEAVRQQLGGLHRRNPIMSALALAPVQGGVPSELTDAVVARTEAELARLQEAIRAGVAAGVVRDVDPHVAATFLWAAWSGLTTLRLRTDELGISDEEFEAVSQLGFRLLATGLLRRSRAAPPTSSRRRKKR